MIVESCILGNAEAGCSAEEIADQFAVPVEIVRRILAFAGVTALDYSDIPELDDQFFATATQPGAMTAADASRQTEPYVICMSCGCLHVGVPHDQPAGDVCFRCKGTDLAEITDREARVRVPRGVTTQAVHWPPRGFV